MGKPTGFLEHDRAHAHRRPVAERLRDWQEVETDVAVAETREQAGRCMDCGVPFCTQGCPLGNPIPDFADAVYRDRWHDAYRELSSTNDFPELTGRICPAPCEGSCVLNIDNAPVTIEALERAIAERAFAEGWVTPQVPAHRTGKRVAVVGSGPAGLAAASQLNQAGHTVIIYEAAARAGGLLRYGIPDFKLAKGVIDRRLDVLRASGIEIRTGVAVGRDPTWTQLRAEHDAVVLAIGAQRARDLAIPGRELEGVVQAMDFLTAQNEVVGGERPSHPRAVTGKHVIILGGGDTGSDCLGTALRQNAASVTQIELMPPPPLVRASDNPWPQWPLVFRTSSSQEEGGAREFGFRTTHLEAADGRLVALHGIKVERKAGQLVDIPGTEMRLPCEALILALGFTGPDAKPLVDQLGIRLDERGNVDGRYATNVPGVFVAGDARRGASLVVWAIAEGRECARAVDARLRSQRAA
ncbi:MAG TPA: glutamate synthase subunit beta [Kofleriaceae bacterium]|nr:glutamate synthase subunit beta [Kofleriaceae bacterium]